MKYIRFVCKFIDYFGSDIGIFINFDNHPKLRIANIYFIYVIIVLQLKTERNQIIFY